MAVLRVPIHTMRDIGTARNALRGEIAEQGYWMPAFHARAAAALTAIAEMILFSVATSMLEMTVIEQEHKKGIELSCELSWLGGELKSLAATRRRRLAEAQRQLHRVTEDVELIEDDAKNPRIIARIWPKEVEK